VCLIAVCQFLINEYYYSNLVLLFALAATDQMASSLLLDCVLTKISSLSMSFVHPSFLRTKMVGDPFYPKFWTKQTPLAHSFTNADFQLIFAHSASAVTLSEKS